MNNVETKMNFNVYTDLDSRKDEYNINIDLDKKVDSITREAVIALSGSVVRNNFKMIYGKTLDDKELKELLKDKLNEVIGKVNDEFKVLNLSLSPVKVVNR